MGDIAKIELSKDLIEPIVRAQLQASITAALGKSEELIAQVVTTCMNLKVDSDGKPCSYSKEPLITWMANKAIKEAAMESIKEWFADNKNEMKAHLRTAIQKNAKNMAESFVLNMSKSVECAYSHKLDITIRPKGD